MSLHNPTLLNSDTNTFHH